MLQIPTNDVSLYRWTIHTRTFQFQENTVAQQKAAGETAVNKKVMQKHGGGMSADGQAQPSPQQTVH